MNILITAGGTSEKIDDVRKISNTATGRLGSMIADTFLSKKNVSVTYVCPKDALVPRNKCADIIYIDNVRMLKLTLEKTLREHTFDAIIHSMAVSDYSVKYNASSTDLANFISENLIYNNEIIKNKDDILKQVHTAITTYQEQENTKKISSDIENLVLCLEKTPKIIELFKKIQPTAILVGFKLLVDVEESQLLHAAKKLMDKNQCDFVFANDQINIDENYHRGLLIGDEEVITRLNTKSEIASEIVNCVILKIEEDKEK